MLPLAAVGMIVWRTVVDDLEWDALGFVAIGTEMQPAICYGDFLGTITVPLIP